MRAFALLLLSILSLAATPLAAQQIAYQQVIVEEVDLADQGGARFVETAAVPVPAGIAAYGPFRVLDSGRAALVDATDERTPGHFTAMLHDYPGIATLEMVECPGTDDDRANLRLGLMIRAKGIATHVPDGGSVRSGAVELFQAGARRMAEPGAEFAVHAWADEDGREPGDYSPEAPENRAYIDYYQEMGMSPLQARSFYAMTNSVPNAEAKWLTASEMGRWVRLDRPVAALDSAPSLP